MRVRDLITAYLDSRAFRKLAPATKQEYLYVLKMSQQYVRPGREASQFTTKEVDRIYERVLINRTHHTAYRLAKVMRKIWNWSIRQGYIQGNPWADMQITAPKAKTLIWTKEQVEAGIATAELLGFPKVKLLIMMCYYLSQRPGDCYNVPCAHLSEDGTMLKIQQGKTGKLLALYVHSRLRKELLAIKNTKLPQFQTVDRYPETFFHDYNHAKLMREWGKVKSYNKWPFDLHISDLRRTAMTEFGDTEATDTEMRANGGHATSSPVMENVYIRRTFTQARNGMLKRFPEEKVQDTEI